MISANDACPASLALCSAVRPAASRACQSTADPRASNSRTTPTLPAAAALCAAVSPPPHLAFGSAPASKRSREIRVWFT
eukprot:scaffold2108_cov66-Isochrysis_galbana.AAC.2